MTSGDIHFRVNLDKIDRVQDKRGLSIWKKLNDPGPPI